MGKKADYGNGHEHFVDYMTRIVEHPNYAGMPDVYLDDGRIQWEAPSNRGGGKFKDTHHKRRRWWETKAKEIGIDITSSQWISRVAKTIHPTKLKPCKKCGRIMDIRYKYPSGHLVRRLLKGGWIVDLTEIDPFVEIEKTVTLLAEKHGETFVNSLPTLLAVSGITVPTVTNSLTNWLRWIELEYIPLEPSTLSPGAMSNAPDRLDGFHSFNLCCRSTADRGRSRKNLASYVTDRRVFEYWVDGDWVAADRLMGFIRSEPTIQSESCLHSHPGPCSADHIGPLSLGFTHRPEFQLLCSSCNSAKNNRMSIADVTHLIEKEKSGEIVISWYATALWDERKSCVDSEETALRLSKLLRDNRHCAVFLLCEILKRGHLTFLTSLLGLHYAEREPLFLNLEIVGHKTSYKELSYKSRQVKYAQEQKARRLRIAFEALGSYFLKASRNFYIVEEETLVKAAEQVTKILEQTKEMTESLDRRLVKAIQKDGEEGDSEFRNISDHLGKLDLSSKPFLRAKEMMLEGMASVGHHLSGMWEHERYVRNNEFDDAAESTPLLVKDD